MDHSSPSARTETPRRTLSSIIAIPTYDEDANAAKTKESGKRYMTHILASHDNKHSYKPKTKSFSSKPKPNLPSVIPKHSRGGAISMSRTIRMKSPRNACQSSDSFKIKGRQKERGEWTYLRPYQIGGSHYRGLPCVFIQRISSYTEKKDIYKRFKYFGNVIDIQFLKVRGKRTACITFRRQTDAKCVFAARYRR